jgi:hypothetical protein
MAMNGLSALPGAGRYAGVLGGVLALGYSLTQSLFNVEGGHRAIVFNRFQGIKDTVGLVRGHGSASPFLGGILPLSLSILSK